MKMRITRNDFVRIKRAFNNRDVKEIVVEIPYYEVPEGKKGGIDGEVEEYLDYVKGRYSTATLRTYASNLYNFLLFVKEHPDDCSNLMQYHDVYSKNHSDSKMNGVKGYIEWKLTGSNVSLDDFS